MATHDYVLDNASGAAFRTDLNNALAAIQSNNSNNSSPANTRAYQWWADTSAGVLKIRNSANNDWIELFQLDGTLTLEAGSVSSPALAFRSDLNTGIYQSNADNLNFAAGGLDRLRLGASTVFNENGFDVDFLIRTDTNNSMFFVDGGNNRISIGTSSPVSSSILEIQAGGNTSFSINTGNNSGDNSTINFGDSADADVGYINYDHGTNVLQFAVGANLAATIDSSGRVLIGTTTEGNSSADDLTIATSSSTGITLRSGTSNSGNIYFSDGTNGNDEFRGFLSYSHTNNDLSIGTDAATRLKLSSSEFTIFGTYSGAAVPNVNLVLGIINSSGGSKKAQIESNKISDISSTIEFHTTKSHSFGERARFDHNGHLLIGATTKVGAETVGLTFDNGSFIGYLAKCTTGGSATFMQFRNSSDTELGNIRTSNGSDLQFNTSASDRSLKKNFENWTENTLELFKNINPQKFNFIQEKDTDSKHKGYVAQDMIDSFPEAYNKNDDNKYMFNPSGMVVYLMKAIQELETKVAALEAA